MNLLIVTGNITKDPELRKTDGGISVVSGTIAVNRAFKDKNGEKQTDYINFVAWDKKADYLIQYAKKGDRLEISGRLESRKYLDRDNQQKQVWECIVENVTSFNKREDAPKAEPAKTPRTPQEAYDSVEVVSDDLPF